MPTTNDDIIARIDALETTLLAQFSDLETNMTNKIDVLGQNLSNSVFEKDAYKEPSNLWYNDVSGSNLNWLGQNFSLDDEYYLSKIQTFVCRFESPGDVTLDVYNVDENGKPVGNILDTITVSESTIPIAGFGPGEGPAWINFEFISPILLSPNEYGYAFVIHAPNLSESNKLRFGMGDDEGASEYDGGDFLSSNDGGQNWTVWTDRDILFKLFTDSPAKLLLIPKINFSRLG